MEIGIKRQAHGGDARDAVLGEDAFQFAAGCFQSGDQRLHLFIFAQFCRDRIQRTCQIVGNREDIARKISRGIGPRIGGFLFHTAADILRVGLRIEHVLLGSGQLFFEHRDAFGIGVRGGLIPAFAQMFGNAFHFLFGGAVGCFVFLICHNLH